MEHSARFESLQHQWQMGYITDSALRGWVELNDRKPGKGITAAEYEEITGTPYEV